MNSDSLEQTSQESEWCRPASEVSLPEVHRSINLVGKIVLRTHLSNEKKKGENNAKCGNRYLAWAFVEAAHFAARFDGQAQRFYQRKKARKIRLKMMFNAISIGMAFCLTGKRFPGVP